MVILSPAEERVIVPASDVHLRGADRAVEDPQSAMDRVSAANVVLGI